jgi:ion channel-forming bestrophin family protein
VLSLLLKIHANKTDNSIGTMQDVQTGTERIAHTPLPLAYRISIAQITWIYIIMLPFQLVTTLSWIAIPATVLAAYIILGILLIGSELENPFGYDVNDLPLDVFCDVMADDIEIMSSRKKPKMEDLVQNPNNKMFFPLNCEGYNSWSTRSEEQLRDQLHKRPAMNLDLRRRGLKAELDEDRNAREEVHVESQVESHV